jgi:MoaA/NifB/PqqE/SkfB family radical SAM enzyme
MYFNILKTIFLNRLRRIQLPSFVTFLVTWRCNARCVFCDIWKKGSSKKEEITPEETKRFFSDFKAIDVFRITGGEPFLRNDIAEIINGVDAATHVSMIHITSNGILTGKIVESLRAVKNLGKIHIKISIDNVGDEHDTVRGVRGAYANAMNTIEELCNLRSRYPGFHVGVNQAIVDETKLDSYAKLKNILDPMRVPIYPVIANQPKNSLYSDCPMVDPKSSIEPFGPFSKAGLERMNSILLDRDKINDSISERVVDSYHLAGLYNRLVHGKNWPNPRCVALRNHLRILPNGDIPICLYNGKVVGNARHQSIKSIWMNPDMKAHRDWVDHCSGCWQSCETAVSAVYTGDIWKGLIALFQKKIARY